MFVRCSEGRDCSSDFVVTGVGVSSDCSCCKGREERDVEDDFHNES